MKMKKMTDVNVNELLSRQDFKTLGFERTRGKCCIPGCGCQAVDAHHIMDRKLWSNGGYYLSNCAPVCEKHHIDCENGVYSPATLMEFCGIDIDETLIPDKLDWIETNDEYHLLLKLELIDKWGN